MIVTPGIRPEKSKHDDQKRVMTPAEAVRAGVDYIVVGRPIMEAKDPVRAARDIIADMEQSGAKVIV
jgi:orotidine-5'-phosphate decarboxylase